MEGTRETNLKGQYLANLVDIENLRKLQINLCSVLEMPLRLLDRAGKTVLGSDVPPCCRVIEGTILGARRCESSRLALLEGVQQVGKPLAEFKCHAGFNLFATPVRYKRDLLGVFIGGPFLTPNGENREEGQIKIMAHELGIAKVSEILNSIRGLRRRDLESVEFLINLLSTQTDLIVEMAYTKFQEEEIVSELVSRYEELVMLYDLGQALSMTTGVDEVSCLVLGKAVQIFGAKKGWVMLLDETDQELITVAYHGMDGDLAKGTRQKVGEGVMGWVAQRGEPFMKNQFGRERDFREMGCAAETFLCVPIKFKGQVLGVIAVEGKGSGDMFTLGDRRLLTTLATQAALSIHHGRLYSQLQCFNEEFEEQVKRATKDLEETNRELREAQERLIHKERLAIIGEMTATISHEVTDPLTVILGQTQQLLRLFWDKDREAVERLEKIEQEAVRIVEVIRRLQDLREPVVNHTIS